MRRVRLCRTLVCALLLAPFGGGSGRGAPLTAGATAAADLERARQLYAEGQREYLAARYAEALTAFSEAYRLSRRPQLLYNIGVCNERLGHAAAALSAYDLYLFEFPKDPDRPAIEARIRFLRATEARSERPAASTTSVGPTAPAAQRSSAPGSSAERASTAPSRTERPAAATSQTTATLRPVVEPSVGTPAPPTVNGTSPAPTAPTASVRVPANATTSSSTILPAPATPSPARDPLPASAPASSPGLEVRSASALPAASSPPTGTQARDPRPLSRRPWFIATVAVVGALAIGGAVAGAVVATSGGGSSLLPGVSFP
jgi:hypothetical protein